MPTIEELYTATKVAAPGWSYVADTGYDPSKVAIDPSSRKRQRAGVGPGHGDGTDISAADWTARQQVAARRHFAELDRDNHKAHQIVTPKHLLGDKKQTTNVRRILQSGKDFAYYLEEEEAMLAQKGPASQAAPEPVANKKSGARSSKTPLMRRKSAVANSLTAPTPDASSQSTPEPSASTRFDAPKTVSSTRAERREATLMDPAPPMDITADEIEVLLSDPPLTYNMARSEAPPADAPRPRVFCEICGFWGRARCLKCGARVCGVACKGIHDESRCVKFYA